MRFLFVSYESPSLPCHFPLGPGLLSALLKREGHEVRGLFVHEELDAASLASLETKVRSIRPDLICFSASSPAAPAIGQLAHHLRSTLGTPAICGGPHPTLYPEETLRMSGIDGVCVGEGERVILEIAQRLSEGRDLHGVPGLWRLDDAGQVIRTGLFPLWNTLSELPHTDFDLFGPEFIQDSTRDGWMRMLASRGCPYSCSYCHTALFRKTYAEGIGVREGQLGYVRFREIPDVIEEIRELAVRHRARIINFVDDLFCMKRSWTLEFCKAFKDQVPQEVGYSIQTHLGHLDAELLHSLKDSRCQRVVVGVESGNRRILGLLNRKADPEVMRERLGLLSSFRFPLGTMTLNLLGNPTETVAEMLDTVSLNASTQVERVRYHILAPYPKSPIHDFCEAEQLFLGDKDLMAYQDRHLTKLRFPAKEAGFLERFGDIGHWYMNLLAPFGLEREYQPLVDELAELPAGVWPEVRERFLRMDAELNAAHQRKGQRHYRPFLNEGLTLPTLGLFEGATV